ncbi:MAG TPA: YdcF family protein [Thiolinea sp.]|nr:YdcF family protein [Thiolinea sp.]
MDNALFNRTLEFLLLPPGNLLLLFLLLIALYPLLKTRPGLLSLLLGLGLLQVMVLSLPATSAWLMDSLEQQYPPQYELWNRQHPLPEAIVVPGAGRNLNAPEYGGQTTSLSGLERLRYAALLHRATGLPILVSGGQPLPDTPSEAELMAHILEHEFQVPVRWREGESHTTWQNALLTDRMLAEDGIRSAWIVTQAWHMPRSLQVFRQQSLTYYPASTSFSSSIPWSELHMRWVPQQTALGRSLLALHEWMGLIWYRLRARFQACSGC